MPNNLEFILKLTDQFSTAMQSAGGISSAVANRITNDINRANQSSRQMALSVNELRQQLERVNQTRFGTRITSEFNAATRQARELERQIERLEGRGQRSGSTGGIMGSIIGGNLVTGLIGKVGSAIMAGGRAIVGGAARQDTDMAGLKTFLGEAGAKEAYGNIKKDAASTPFDTAGLLMVNRSLISAGLSAKDARRDTMNLANAISAVGGSNDELSRMAANMQQIKTVGKATAMDIRQFGFAGINIYKILSDATGKSIDQVKTMDVSYDLLSKSLQRAAEKGGAYFGAMEAQSKTIPGQWSNFMDNINNKASEIGTALKPVMMWFINVGIGITDNFSKIMPYVQPVVDVLNSIPNIINDITSPTSVWVSYIRTVKDVAFMAWDTFKSILGNVWHIVGGVVTWIGKSELLKDIFSVIGDFVQFAYFSIQQIGNALSWIWDNIIKPVLNAVDSIYSKVKSLLGGKAEIQVTQSIKALSPSGLNMPGSSANPINLNGDRSSKTTGKDFSDQHLGKVAKSNAESINSGGQRSVIINIGKQIEKLEVHVMDAKDGVNEIEGMVREAMRRVLYNMNGVAS